MSTTCFLSTVVIPRPRARFSVEGLNSIIQNIKRRARGFRNPEYFKTMIYLVAGNLDFSRWTQALKCGYPH
ncbi:transposase [Sutterella seckii]|uniref:Transposase n=1 Tax=Sutterella seckii TaxID=1944635 RepID=A0A6I1EV96_9BURK|nr:transposase [Sutterella seckii]